MGEFFFKADVAITCTAFNTFLVRNKSAQYTTSVAELVAVKCQGVTFLIRAMWGRITPLNTFFVRVKFTTLFSSSGTLVPTSIELLLIPETIFTPSSFSSASRGSKVCGSIGRTMGQKQKTVCSSCFPKMVFFDGLISSLIQGLTWPSQVAFIIVPSRLILTSLLSCQLLRTIHVRRRLRRLHRLSRHMLYK